MKMARPRNLVVVGGGGRGAVEALCLLLDDLPVPMSARILVAIEDPLQTVESMRAALQGHTRLTVSMAQDGDVVPPECVCLAPQDQHLAIGPDFRVMLQRGDLIHGKRPAADVLFSSAAQHFGNQVIGVILSGGKEDGVAGFRDIHAAGGLRLIQSPSTATNPGMPLWGTLEDHPDLLCAPQEMGPLLGHLLRGDALF
ncbi:hypothetical protein EBE87_23160 [Pseudoroseomonas wenyumeiae]|uniref:protein-glutamate methylesterase n=2 Tax=Teichococcus wenyumeiae TaxID=2478470 RepID=A0A3A9JZZ0_9PROT|nr:hypothetical protein D6Z83_08150 [Pseudoroseomonas wenyumeiae]RMI17328.1 hypothetical protein EBE87_23160 [Pseudoroseomonas wenyumeiae]